MSTAGRGCLSSMKDIGWWDKTFHKDLSCCAVPRDREAMHFLIVGVDERDGQTGGDPASFSLRYGGARGSRATVWHDSQRWSICRSFITQAGAT